MSDTFSSKSIPDLPEKTAPVDADLAVVGNAGGASMRKLSLANLANYIRDKLASLTFSGLNTTDKTLPGAVNEVKSGSYSLTGGTEIPNNSDLNAAAFCKEGHYYCTSTANANTLSNLPAEVPVTAFRITVEDLSGAFASGSYKYGLRIFKTFTSSTLTVDPQIYIQKIIKAGASVEWTFGPWIRVPSGFNLQSLGSSFDMNTVTKSGLYYYAAPANIQNAPSADYGYLHMLVIGVGGFITQVVFGGRQATAPASHKIWLRYKTSTVNDTWTDWYAFAHEADPTIRANTYQMGGDGLAVIPNDTDLNTLTTPGSYISLTSSNTATMANSPVTGSGFSLHVEALAGASKQYVVQTVKRRNSGIENVETYTRTYGGSSWGDWKQVPTREEISALQTAVNRTLYMQNAGTSKKLRVTLTNTSRGSVLVNGVDNDGNPQTVSLVWNNAMTAATVTHIVGTGTAFDTYAIDADAMTVEMNLPNYFTGTASSAINNANAVVEVVAR